MCFPVAAEPTETESAQQIFSTRVSLELETQAARVRKRRKLQIHRQLSEKCVQRDVHENKNAIWNRHSSGARLQTDEIYAQSDDECQLFRFPFIFDYAIKVNIQLNLDRDVRIFR